jgi:glutamine amidotransferase
MNAARESDIGLSWPDFCERGGKSDVHADGWGMAYYIGTGLCQFHDVEPASTSALAAFLGKQTIRTCNLLAHIRYATTGGIHLANVHPFSREMWALHWCFCHNGQIPLFEDHPDYMLDGGYSNERFYFPVGDTDSEMAFCAILNALRAEFTDTMPTLPVLYEKLQSLCREIVDYDPQRTILNFLLTGGPHVLWVYSWPGRRPGSSVWNGLYYSVRSQNVAISDEDVKMDVQIGDSDVCVVATKPMTDDEEWIELRPGELIVLDNGIPHVTPAELFRIEMQGHGLNNDGKVLRPPRLEEDMRRFALHREFFVGGGI